MLSPEQSQQITDLRQRMLRNVAAGLPAHADITEEEIKLGLSFLRSNRAASAAGATKTKKVSSKKTSSVIVDTKAFTDIDLD